MALVWQMVTRAFDSALAKPGFGRTRFFTRYARSIAPWFHPPRWVFNIFLNAFLDQACSRPSPKSLVRVECISMWRACMARQLEFLLFEKAPGHVLLI